MDVANFDPDFTNEEAQDSVVTDSVLPETVQDQFRGFTYNPANEYLGESVSYAANSYANTSLELSGVDTTQIGKM